ncbi:TRAP transporter small permease [Ancylobacter pratisalsi]|uniref:TRAP transporter small permease protein n=1 Tax=Ancylobacter pratisalsi TaxID=1745854 RepID=A0A6P1YPH7_9HYPH|nr:TRAP transporter small permease subunit [Ancylobacter pratisalsi]QIB34631.1 TRAP transporter small permease [Ancylobacter pratisalsi]
MRLLNAVERMVQVAAFAMFAAMFVLTLAQVLFRYFLQIPVPWTEEAARALFVMSVLSGIALAYRQREHVVVDFLFAQFSPRMKRGFSIAFGLSILFFLAFWASGAILMAQRNWSISLITISWFRISYYYLWELAMIALLAVYVLIDLKNLLTGRIVSLQTGEQEIDL